ENVRARLLWDVARVQVDILQSRMENTSIAGILSINLQRSRPSYKLDVNVKGFNYQSGKLDGTSTMETSGTGLQLATNLTADGTFTGAGVDLGGLACRTVSGSYSLAWGQTAPKLRLTSLSVHSEDDTYTGRGSTLDDGRLVVALTN